MTSIYIRDSIAKQLCANHWCGDTYRVRWLACSAFGYGSLICVLLFLIPQGSDPHIDPDLASSLLLLGAEA
jgi:hypothetical protein